LNRSRCDREEKDSSLPYMAFKPRANDTDPLSSPSDDAVTKVGRMGRKSDAL
jgi:hypothetical protein